MSPSPFPFDLIWRNAHIPLHRILARRTVANSLLFLVALCWSAVISFIFAVANLDSFSSLIPSIRKYSSTSLYIVMNDYLAIGVLLVLISLLPVFFDAISRYFEREKTEAAIQKSVMTRSFYFQLANIYVTVGFGSILVSLNEVLDNPSNIFVILGASLPSVSLYFAKFVMLKALTSIPLELLRIGPLLQYLMHYFGTGGVEEMR